MSAALDPSNIFMSCGCPASEGEARTQERMSPFFLLNKFILSAYLPYVSLKSYIN